MQLDLVDAGTGAQLWGQEYERKPVFRYFWNATAFAPTGKGNCSFDSACFELCRMWPISPIMVLQSSRGITCYATVMSGHVDCANENINVDEAGLLSERISIRQFFTFLWPAKQSC